MDDGPTTKPCCCISGLNGATVLRVAETANQLVIRVRRGGNQHCQCGRIVYIVRLYIVFSKAALQKRGSMEPMEPRLDPPLFGRGWVRALLV